ncbi:MAG: 5-formyltetrahydrofolate cyclo-ligase, partial [Steroidobacteraceae bacterium]
RLLTARRLMTPADRRAADQDLYGNLRNLLAERRPRTVAAYVPMASEPFGSAEEKILPEVLAADDLRPQVLLPVWRGSGELAWASYTGPQDLVSGTWGILESRGDATHSLADADLILVPALAVNPAGYRLGRGAGCYDRALRHTRGLTVAVVYEAELGLELPICEHDVPVDATMAPSGTRRMQ